MKRKLLLLSAIVPLLLTSCEKEDSYFKQFSVSNIISDTGRVRVVDSIYGTVSPFDTQILLQLYSSPSNAITFSQDFDFLIKNITHYLTDIILIQLMVKRLIMLKLLTIVMERMKP